MSSEKWFIMRQKAARKHLQKHRIPLTLQQKRGSVLRWNRTWFQPQDQRSPGLCPSPFNIQCYDGAYGAVVLTPFSMFASFQISSGTAVALQSQGPGFALVRPSQSTQLWVASDVCMLRSKSGRQETGHPNASSRGLVSMFPTSTWIWKQLWLFVLLTRPHCNILIDKIFIFCLCDKNNIGMQKYFAFIFHRHPHTP